MLEALVRQYRSLSADAKEKLFLVIATSVITSIITIFIPKVVWPAITRCIGWLREQIYRRVAGFAVFNAWGLSRYRRGLRQNLERIPNPWSSQRLRLTTTFVPIEVQKDYSLPHLVPGQRRAIHLFDLRSVPRQYARFVLVGDPGAGKSTALKALGMAALNGELLSGHNGKLPVFVELKRYAPSGRPLEGYLIEVFAGCGFPDASGFIRRALTGGRLLLMLDGLDEVNQEDFGVVTDAIRSFCQEYPSNQVAIACRTAAYERQLDDLSDATVGLTEFNDIQIVTFLRRWTFPPGKSLSQLMRQLRDRPRILALCRNPLMLTIVASLYVETDYELPSSRAEFYTTCIEAVLKRWDSFREIDRHNRFAASVKLRVLQLLALTLQRARVTRGDIEQEDLEAFMTDVLPAMGLSPLLAEDLIAEIVRNSGLLMYVAPRRLRFAHMTFQEFFAARELDSKGEAQALTAHVREDVKRWREVCLLFCGISLQSDDLISALAGFDVALAAQCIAEAQAVSADLASSVLDGLEERLGASDGGEMELRAVSMLAADHTRVWTERALGILRRCLRHEAFRQGAVSALANVPTAGAAKELVAALHSEDTAPVARQALVRLGAVALPAIRKVLQETPDASLRRTCLAIAGQVASPEVVDVVLPWVQDDDWRTRASAGWALGSLLQDPSVESALQLTRPEDIRHSGVSDSAVVRELSEWVWPFETDANSALPEIIALIVDSLPFSKMRAVAGGLSAFSKLDIRVAIPVVIEGLLTGSCHPGEDMGLIGFLLEGIPLPTSLSQGSDPAARSAALEADLGRVPVDTAIPENWVAVAQPGGPNGSQSPTERIGRTAESADKLAGDAAETSVIVDFGDESGQENGIEISIGRRAAEPRLDATTVIPVGPRMSELVRQYSPYRLKGAWASVAKAGNDGEAPLTIGSRRIARLMGQLLVASCLLLSGLSSNVLRERFLRAMVLLPLSVLTYYLAACWCRLNDESVVDNISSLPVGGWWYAKALFLRKWPNRKGFLVLVGSLTVTLLWILCTILCIRPFLGGAPAWMIALGWVALASALFAVDWNPETQRNPWSAFLRDAAEGSSIFDFSASSSSLLDVK